MFIHIAGRNTKVSEFPIILGVRNDCHGMLAVKLKPLTPLTPPLQFYLRQHRWVIPPPTKHSRIVEYREEAVLRCNQIVINDTEVEHR